MFDGAIISGSFMPASSKWFTYEFQNFPTIKELFRYDGIEYNFVGVIMSNLNVALDQKERSCVMSCNIALNLGVDYAIITEEGYGNPDTDYVRMQVIFEDAGIPVVGISNESDGRDGFGQPLVTLDEKMNANVSTGNVGQLTELPACKTVIGNLEALNRDGMYHPHAYLRRQLYGLQHRRSPCPHRRDAQGQGIRPADCWMRLPRRSKSRRCSR